MRNDQFYSSRQRYGQSRMPHRPPARRSVSTGLTVFIDVLAAALLLLFFYITNYVIQTDVEGVPLTSPSADISASGTLAPTPSTASPTESASATEDGMSPSPTVEQSATAPASTAPALPGMWRAKFADKFTTGAVEKTDTSYKSANVNVTINKVQEDGVTYFVSDIYLADIKYFKTSFGSTNKLGQRDFVDDVLKANAGIVGINSDNVGHNPCLLIRNGMYYRSQKSTSDALVMYNDGTMKTIPASQFDANKVKADAPYQVWGFGPMLLNNGQAMTKFNSPANVSGNNPRSAIGYYEPGHYCFVVVEGRVDESKGYSFTDLSNLFHSLGCKVAFNFDGGGTSAMGFMGNRISTPCSDYRKADDVVYITDSDN